MRAKPCPIRLELSRAASYKFEFFGSLDPPVSKRVSPAWNRKGMSSGSPFTRVFLHVFWKARSSVL